MHGDIWETGEAREVGMPLENDVPSCPLRHHLTCPLPVFFVFVLENEGVGLSLLPPQPHNSLYVRAPPAPQPEEKVRIFSKEV